jgi:hypothetical protein
MAEASRDLDSSKLLLRAILTSHDVISPVIFVLLIAKLKSVIRRKKKEVTVGARINFSM